MAIEEIPPEAVFQFAFETLQAAVTTIDEHTSDQPTRNALYAAMFGTAGGMLETLLLGLDDPDLVKVADAARLVGVNLLVAEATEAEEAGDGSAEQG